MIDMPTVIVLFVCKTMLAAAPTANDKFTGHENRVWATENSMMICRRQEIQLTNLDESAPWNQSACARAAVMLGARYDIDNKRSVWRIWRVGCPVPTINTITGEIIAWTLPPCPHRDIAVCLVDSVI